MCRVLFFACVCFHVRVVVFVSALLVVAILRIMCLSPEDLSSLLRMVLAENKRLKKANRKLSRDRAKFR